MANSRPSEAPLALCDAAPVGRDAVAARIFLIGDYALFRECLASMLAGLGHVRLLGQADDLHQAEEHLASESADVVLFDVGRPDDALYEAIRSFTDRHPQTRIIVLGLDEIDREILRFIESGASAYVLKEASVNELSLIIDRVLRGEAVCSPKIASTMFSRLADLARERRREEQLEALQLTPRELEILRLIADGLSNKEIAAQLYLSFHTVKNHVHNILEKLKVQHRSQAVEYAVRKRWLKVHEHGLGEPHGRLIDR
ncbi:MAG: response regulator transcription factor [Acidobacteriota bacterium]